MKMKMDCAIRGIGPVAFSIVLGVSASAALAQNWSGSYFGGSVGAGNSDVSWTDVDGGWYTFGPGYSYTATDKTTVYGLQFGSLTQREDNTVFGWEIGITSVGHNTNIDSLLFPGSDDWTTKMEGMLTATAKAGVANGRWLPYAEGGLALANLRFVNTDDGFCGPPCVLNQGGLQAGLIFGIGLDYRVSDKVFVGIGYRNAIFANQTYVGVPTNRVTPETYNLGGVSQTLLFHVNVLLD